jgi:hypothetical protein
VTKYAVKLRPLSRVLSTTVALVTTAAWLLAANHCAVAGLVPKTTGHEHCAADTPADSGKPNDCDGLNCCKSLSAPAAFAKKLAGYDKAFYMLKDYVVSEFVFPSDQRGASISELDTGPPPAHCFAESILQRSLLAHAPPSLS